jgi:hypothetical protein
MWDVVDVETLISGTQRSCDKKPVHAREQQSKDQHLGRPLGYRIP